MFPRPAVCLGRRHLLGVAPPGLPLVQDRATAAEAVAGARRLPHRLATTGPTIRATPRHQLGPGPHRRLQEAVKKGGEQTGPSPVDRGKCGPALHLACDNRAMPLGVVITGANAADGCQAQDVLEAVVVRPPQPEQTVAE